MVSLRSLDHESQTEGDLGSFGLVEFHAGHTVPVSGTVGLGAVAVGVEVCHAARYDLLIYK